MNTIRGYLYTRVSSLKQVEDKNGLQRQSDLVSKWLERHPEVELDTTFTFKDAGKSAFKGKMLEQGASLAKFLAAVESGLIQTPCYLLIEHLDRITRLPPTEARERVVIPLLKAGVAIVTVSDGFIYSLSSVNNSDGTTSHIDMMLTMFLNMAYQYSKKLSDRVSHAKKEKRLAASEVLAPMGAMCPQYLRVVTDAAGIRHFEEIPEAVAIVKRIFNERAYGSKSINQIARDLNSEGVPVLSHHLNKKGKALWSSATISTLLKNESVLGILKESKHLNAHGQPKYPAVANYYPQVIDLPTWEKVQRLSLRGKPVSQRTFAAATNIFRGYIDCKHCKKRMTINGVRIDFPGSITCRSRRAGLCDAPTFSMKTFEDAVINHLFASLSEMETSDGTDQRLQTLTIELDVAQREFSNFEQSLTTATNATVIGVLVANMEKAQSKIDACKETIEKLKRAIAVKTKFTLKGLDMTVKNDREKARDIITEHIECIILDTKGKKVDVYLRNGNAVLGFDLVNVSDQTVLLTQALAPDDKVQEWLAIAGVDNIHFNAS
ncbi:TPA: recombinase family protein [Klebsiella aerogenes]|nr:recombinase family protein [Klebsiella aerogenes]